MWKLSIAAVCAAIPAASLASEPSVLARHVARPEPALAWVQRSAGVYRGAEYVELILTSQTWRDSVWKHQLYIVVPEEVNRESRQALLFIDGGSWREEYERPPESDGPPKNADEFWKLANRVNAPVVIIRQIPHQPMFGGMKEDALIAYTFEQYLDSRDPDWPLLVPMVKAVTMAMDVAQSFLRSHWSIPVDTFTATGASKRGWTTWLSAAVDDRITALAPMVFDVLNITEQLKHQRNTWGDYSAQIEDYTSRDIPRLLDSEAGADLVRIVDPYCYRADLAQPKLIVLGTNDEYWPVDALNLYWSQLIGPKYILYVPNVGHDLGNRRQVIDGLGALHQHAATGSPLPNLTWEFETREDELILSITADIRPVGVRAWRAQAPSRDFRAARWRARGVRHGGDSGYAYRLELPESGYAALFGEVSFKGDDYRYSLSTTVHVATASGGADDIPAGVADAAIRPAIGQSSNHDASLAACDRP